MLKLEDKVRHIDEKMNKFLGLMTVMNIHNGLVTCFVGNPHLMDTKQFSEKELKKTDI